MAVRIPTGACPHGVCLGSVCGWSPCNGTAAEVSRASR